MHRFFFVLHQAFGPGIMFCEHYVKAVVLIALVSALSLLADGKASGWYERYIKFYNETLPSSPELQALWSQHLQKYHKHQVRDSEKGCEQVPHSELCLPYTVPMARKRAFIRRENENPKVEDSEGKLATRPEDIVCIVSTDFEDKFVDKEKDITPPFQGTAKPLVKEITTEEIRKSFNSLSNNKSPSDDNINGKLLKYGMPLLDKTIAAIYNTAFEKHENLDVNGGVLIAIQKPGKKKEYLSKNQSGFRPERTTADVIWTHRWLAAKTLKEDTTITISGIDMSAAFDAINRRHLLEVVKRIVDEGSETLEGINITDREGCRSDTDEELGRDTAISQLLIGYIVDGPQDGCLTILCAATHETGWGYHDSCLSRSHYTDTNPTSGDCNSQDSNSGPFASEADVLPLGHRAPSEDLVKDWLTSNRSIESLESRTDLAWETDFDTLGMPSRTGCSDLKDSLDPVRDLDRDLDSDR
ncbi:hypothetical protein EGW08_008037 [Elysia chlorotica]|uniref:Reverse transcriptase domain-containing protein n=1 Tax=Elysia chlorotica TaxID=188477 RepID=A0A3S0ZRK2_ELYCH|nr:hypothetical protein EGW08_008037 [Elysia chlorotica]